MFNVGCVLTCCHTYLKSSAICNLQSALESHTELINYITLTVNWKHSLPHRKNQVSNLAVNVIAVQQFQVPQQFI